MVPSRLSLRKERSARGDGKEERGKISGNDHQRITPRAWLCLNHTVQKDSRGVLGMSFRFGPTSEILENIQYGGSSVVEN